MKILIDARLYGLENAGLGRYAMNLIEYLQKIDSKNDYVVLLREKYYNKLKLAGNWTKVLADFRHYSIEEQTKLPKLIREINPDLTHFLHFNIPVFWKGKFVVTIHDMLMHKYGLSATTLPAPLYWLKKFGYKKVFGEAVKRSLGVVVPSQAVKKELVEYYRIDSGKVKVTYEGVDEEIGMAKTRKEIELEYKINSKYFVYAGNAYPHKNLDRLIEALVTMNKNVEQKIILAIASSRNVFTTRLEKLIKKFKAEDSVKLLGFVSDDALGSLYKFSEGFIFPSLSEGFGLPGLEAMQSGTLVLASDIPVFREIYKDVALYFNPYDFTSIEKVMLGALEIGEVKRGQKISEGQKLAKAYSWAKMAEETLKVYESCNSIRPGQ